MSDANPWAPGALDRIRELINTRFIEQGTDAVATPAALEVWLRERELLPSREALGPADVAELQAAREALRELAALNHGAALGGRQRHRRRDRAFAEDRLRRATRGNVVALPRLRARDVPLGVLRSHQEPLGAVVRDVDLRQPRESTPPPHARPRGLAHEPFGARAEGSLKAGTFGEQPSGEPTGGVYGCGCVALTPYSIG